MQVEVSGKVLEASVHRAVTENADSAVAGRFPEEQAVAVPQDLVEGLFVLLAKGWVQVADIPQFGFQCIDLFLQFISQRCGGPRDQLHCFCDYRRDHPFDGLWFIFKFVGISLEPTIGGAVPSLMFVITTGFKRSNLTISHTTQSANQYITGGMKSGDFFFDRLPVFQSQQRQVVVNGLAFATDVAAGQ